MVFGTVFSALQDVFPQVDLRILKAVAIEHSTDVDAAVEFILCDVVPSLSEPQPVHYTLHDSHEAEQSSAEECSLMVPHFQNVDRPNKQFSYWGVEGLGESSSNLLPGPSSLAPEIRMVHDYASSNQVISAQREFVGEVPYVAFGGEMLFPGIKVNSIAPAERESVEEEAPFFNHIVDSFRANVNHLNESVPIGSSSDAPGVGVNSIAPAGRESVEKETPFFNHIVDSFQANANHLNKSAPIGSSSDVPTGNYIDQLIPVGKHEEVSSTNITQPFQSAVEESETESSEIHEPAGLEDNVALFAIHTGSQDASLLVPENNLDSQEHGVVEKDITGFLSKNGRLSKYSAEVADVQDCGVLEANCALSEYFSPTEDSSSSAPDKWTESLQSRTAMLGNFNTLIGTEEEGHICPLEDGLEVSFHSESLAVSNESACTATRSSQAVSIEFLEELILDAKYNKKLLASAMESIRNLMEEVQLREDAAKQAKEEACVAGQDIHNKVEEFREMLKHAREANNMHAGEVYGEKSILATEARELQSRLVNLSDKRVIAQNTIDEMRQTLEGRLAAAKEEIAAAEQEKLEKEALERKALGEQEIIMDSIVQEAKRLQQEAEENAKLREFLMDRGRTIDILQGEIAVICEDSMMMKERVDARLPLGRSLSSRPSSLASSLSTSSHPSVSSDRIHLVEVTENPVLVIQEQWKSQEMENPSSFDKEIYDNKENVFSDDWELCEA